MKDIVKDGSGGFHKKGDIRVREDVRGVVRRTNRILAMEEDLNKAKVSKKGNRPLKDKVDLSVHETDHPYSIGKATPKSPNITHIVKEVNAANRDQVQTKKAFPGKRIGWSVDRIDAVEESKRKKTKKMSKKILKKFKFSKK